MFGIIAFNRDLRFFLKMFLIVAVVIEKYSSSAGVWVFTIRERRVPVIKTVKLILVANLALLVC